jgi:hypothetical protein
MTRSLSRPRLEGYDASGIPLHADNETIIQERIYLDKADPSLMHDDITTIDHALSRPWVVNQVYKRKVSDKPLWLNHEVCGEGNNHVGIGKENYFLSGDGFLMPTRARRRPTCAISRRSSSKDSPPGRISEPAKNRGIAAAETAQTGQRGLA